MKELQVLQSGLSDIEKENGAIVAISADSEDQVKTAADKLGLKFSVCADPDLKAISAFGLDYAPQIEEQVLKHKLARPAIYFVNADGTVASSYTADDYRKHITPETLKAEFAKTK